MLKDNPRPDGQDDLFRNRLEQMIDMSRELVRLSSLISWNDLAKDLEKYYCSDNGRLGGLIRLMVGLCYLKDISGLSDEYLCAQWRDNP